MKKLTLILTVAAAVVVLMSLVTFAAQSGSIKTVKRGPLVHMVSFKFKPEATAAQIKEVEVAFGALKTKIPQIVSYEWGTNISPEKLDKGFTHGFILTFADDKDRDVYLKHPDHQAFGKIVGPVLGDVFVVDFQARD